MSYVFLDVKSHNFPPTGQISWEGASQIPQVCPALIKPILVEVVLYVSFDTQSIALNSGCTRCRQFVADNSSAIRLSNAG